MCMVSNVYDQWNPWFPQPNTIPPPAIYPSPNTNVPPTIQVQGVTVSGEDLRTLIDAFHKAVEAAKAFDAITGQPDCEDPEKAKLEKRVAELEKRLDEYESRS